MFVVEQTLGHLNVLHVLKTMFLTVFNVLSLVPMENIMLVQNVKIVLQNAVVV